MEQQLHKIPTAIEDELDLISGELFCVACKQSIAFGWERGNCSHVRYHDVYEHEDCPAKKQAALQLIND